MTFWQTGENYNKKKIFFYSGNLSKVSRLNLPKHSFICTFFFNDNDWDIENLSAAIDSLINIGCVFFLFHGNRCEKAHDIADEIAVEKEIVEEKELSIMTTWHNNQSEKEVIYEALRLFLPDEQYLDKFNEDKESYYIFFSFGDDKYNFFVQDLLSP